MFFRRKATPQFSISIPEPCSENWNSMHVVDQVHRHCDSCAKNVVDFSQMSDDELVLYLRHAQGNICGRLRTDQLNRTYTALPENVKPSVWWRAAVLLPFTFFAKTSSAQQNDSAAVADTNFVAVADGTSADSLTNIDTVLDSTIFVVGDTLLPKADSGIVEEQRPKHITESVIVSVGASIVYGGMRGWQAPYVPATWSLLPSLFGSASKRKDSSIEQPVAALLDDKDSSQPDSDPVTPTLPERPWYEAVLPQSWRIRKR